MKSARLAGLGALVFMLLLTLLVPAFATIITNISDNPTASRVPDIAIDGNDDVHVVWEDEGDIFLASSTDFSSPINISNDVSSSRNPAVAASGGGDIYVTWVDSDSTEVFLANSTDGYAGVINVSNNAGDSADPDIAISDGGDVFVVWADDDDIFVANSTDGYAGATNISNNGASTLPRIAITSTGDVYVTWQDASPDVFIASSTDGYASSINISDNAGNSVDPAVAVSGTDDVYVTWQDDGPDGEDVFLANSTDNFDGEINVSNNVAVSSSPDIAILDGDIYMVWKDFDLDSGLSDVYSARSIGDDPFSDAINVSQNSDVAIVEPLVRIGILSTGDPRIAWHGDGPDSADIFLAEDIDYIPPTITVDATSTVPPRWDLDDFGVEGIVSNADPDDTVTVDWGDGSITDSIEIDDGDGSWSATHTYDSSAVFSNPNAVIASVVDPFGFERAAADPLSVDVEKHATTLTLDPVASVLAGSDIEATGVLVDADAEVEIEGLEITFDGTGAASLDPATTALDGSFAATGASPGTVEDLLTVQGLFAGDDLYLESSSTVRTYDTVDGTATSFAVSAGADVEVDLTGFGASVVFDEIETAGDLFVSDCATPADPRYISMDLCLRLSSGFVMAQDSSAHIEFSFEGAAIPDGHAADEVSVFHEGTSGMVDITESRDAAGNTTTGVTDEFSNFIVAIPDREEQPEGSVRKQVFVGDGSEIALRDMVTPDSPDAEISLDQESYEMSDTATLTIIDADANLDPDETDSITATVTSDTSGPGGGIDLVLEETGESTGTFTATFTFTAGASAGTALQAAAGDDISVEYDQTFGARFEATFEGVEEAGAAQVSDYVVEDEGDVPFDPVGYAVELELVDASVAVNGTTITMSYANGLFLDGAQRELLKVFKGERQLDSSVDWNEDTISTIDFGTGFTEGVDTDAETVTVTTTAPGIFMLGYDIGEPGGGGGGLPRPGTGIVLDAVASIAGAAENDEEDTGTSGGGGGNRVVVIKNEPIDDDVADAPVETFPKSHFEENPLDRVEVSSTGFMDAEGNDVSEANVGQQISIASTFSNHQQEPQKYSFIIVIIDEDGFAVDVAWQEGTVESGQTVDLSISWMPQDGGNYTVKMFVWDGLDNPTPLSNATVNNIIVL